MAKLLSANFRRLFKSKLFWFEMAAMAIIAISQYRPDADPTYFEQIFFRYTFFTGFFAAIFTGLFIGTDYHDGTLRNKIIIGHNRHTIYLSNLIVCFTAALLFNAAWMLPILAVGIPLYGWFTIPGSQLLLYILLSILMTLALVSIFTLIGMLYQNKAGAVVALIVVFLLILFAAAYLDNMLRQPEMINQIFIPVNGVYEADPDKFVPNPNYITGVKRKIVEVLYDILPAGQAAQIFTLQVARPALLSLYSLLITLITTGLGLLLFRKKDLK